MIITTVAASITTSFEHLKWFNRNSNTVIFIGALKTSVDNYHTGALCMYMCETHCVETTNAPPHGLACSYNFFKISLLMEESSMDSPTYKQS